MLNRREFLTVTGAGGVVLLFGIPNPIHALTTEKEENIMPYAAKDCSKLIGMEGFSEMLLKNHFTLRPF